MVELIFILFIGSIVAFFYGKLKKYLTQKNEEWLVIYHSINSNIKLFELQNLLNRNGIKTKIEMDDKPLTNAVKSYYSDKSDTVLKLLVPEKCFFKAKQLFNEETY
jgi:hypothetical protein